MKYKDLESVFRAFEDLKVLIIGDVMIDSYIYGKVDRISPEAPVPIVQVEKRENRLGGAANVALNIQALGATPILCSIIGDDPEAELFQELLKIQGISSKGIIKSNKRITTVKNRVVAGSQQMLRFDQETDQSLDSLEQKSLLDHISKLIDDVDLVIFEDYDKGCLNDLVIKESIRLARKKEIPTAVDPKNKNFLSYVGCSMFKPNLRELKYGLQREFDEEVNSELDTVLHELQSKLDFEKALITLSNKGIVIFENNNSTRIPAYLRSVADVSGAGDTVIAIASLCLVLGLSNSFIAQLSNLGGGIVCEYVGVVPIEKERLFHEAEESDIFELLA